MDVNVIQENENPIILVVEDDKMLLSVIPLTLECLGYKNLSTDDGQKAIDIYRDKNSEIGLVMLDLTMPKPNGYETWQELKKINPNVKVLIMSGYDKTGGKQEMMSEGCRFIQKPFLKKDLDEEIKKILNPN